MVLLLIVCMFMLVIKLIKDFFFLDIYLRVKYEFVLNYFYLYCFLFIFIIIIMDLEIFFGCGEGVGWEGKIIYVFFWIVWV